MSKLEFNYEREVFKLKWEIPKFSEVLKNKNIKEYRTKKSSDDSRPQLRVLLLGQDNDLIEIYFLCPVTEYLKYNVRFEGLWVYGCEKHGKCDGARIEANKWQYLGNILRKDTIRNDNEHRSLFIIITITFLNQSYPKYTNKSSGVIDTSLFTDVVMKSNDGKEYKAHKFILARNSAVLKAHFEHDTIENHTNIVEAPFESDVVEEIISYMYSDKILKMNTIPDKILAAADFYQLDELKKLCAEEMSKQLTVENASKTLDLADLYHADTLKLSTIEFMKEGVKEFVSTEAWETQISSDLFKRIYKCVEGKESQVQYHEDKSE